MDASVTGRAYATLAELLAGSPSAIAAARHLAPFDEWLAGRADEDVLAAHYRAFGLNAFPHAGVYTGAEALISDADDLASALARLAAREDPGELSALLAWLPPFVAALRQLDSVEPWGEVVDLAVALVASRAASLKLTPVPVEHPAFEVGDGDGLREVAAQLAIPRTAGVLLPVDALRALARRLDLPAGFGSRRQLIARFLESAATYGSAGPALEGLEELVRAQVRALESLPIPCDRWLAQAEATRATLSAMRSQLAAEPARV